MEPRPIGMRERLVKIRRLIIWVSSGTLCLLVAALVFVPVDERVRATGAVWPSANSRLHALEDGLLGEVAVREGAVVKTGDALVSMDTTGDQERLRTVEASITSAMADVSLQKLRLERILKIPLPAEFWYVQEELLSQQERSAQTRNDQDRATELYAKGLISAQDLEQTRLAVELSKIEELKIKGRSKMLDGGLEKAIRDEATAEYDASVATLRSLEVEREILQEAIHRATLRAEADGTVTLVTKRRSGQRVDRGEPLVYLAHGPVNRAELFADESQLHRVQAGQRVLMSSMAFDPLRDGYIEGRVESVALQPESSVAPATGADVPSYRIIVAVDHSPQVLVGGSRVEAKVILRRVPLWRLLFPNTAVK